MAADPVIICDFGGSKLAEHVGLWRTIWLYTTAPQLLVGVIWHVAAVYTFDLIRQKLVCTQVRGIVFPQKNRVRVP